MAHGLEGAVVGATDVAGLDGVGEAADEDISATAHGVEKLAERGITPKDIALTKTGQVLTQADGATVYLKEISPGRYNVVIEGQRGVITALKNIPQTAVNRPQNTDGRSQSEICI